MNPSTSYLPSQNTTTVDASIASAVWYRISAVIGLLILTNLLASLRSTLVGLQVEREDSKLIPLAFLVLTAYEFGALIWLTGRIRAGLALPSVWIFGNVVIECSFPTTLIVLVWFSGMATAEQIIASPIPALYGMFIVLSVLHLKPIVCLVGGTAAALGYAVVVIAAVYDMAGDSPPGIITISLRLLSAAVVWITALAAALVANRARHFVRTAVMEAGQRARAERELATAAQIQKSLMPDEHARLKGFDIVGWNRPADETGGDYFDWVELPDGSLAVIIADVSGHGLGPAMVTAFCRAYARMALRTDGDLVRAITRLNQEMVDDLGHKRFVTFAVAQLRPDESRVAMYSAGHGPIFITRKQSNAIESFDADSLPLGITDTLLTETVTEHQLDTGDSLVFLTDGFFEWANASGEQFGLDRLQQSLTRHAKKPVQDLVSELLNDLEAFVEGTPQPDDLTIVIARRTS
ncbi:MAG: PP2C family protein-serine/threonine phosphatase [Phycisphaerae bacterium]